MPAVELNKDSRSWMIDLHRLTILTIKSPTEVHRRKGREARKMGAEEIIGGHNSIPDLSSSEEQLCETNLVHIGQNIELMQYCN